MKVSCWKCRPFTTLATYPPCCKSQVSSHHDPFAKQIQQHILSQHLRRAYITKWWVNFTDWGFFLDKWDQFDAWLVAVVGQRFACTKDIFFLVGSLQRLQISQIHSIFQLNQTCIQLQASIGRSEMLSKVAQLRCRGGLQ